MTIITFAVLLTGLVHTTVGLPSVTDFLHNPDYVEVIARFDVFMGRLGGKLNSSEAKNLPWISKVARDRLIEDLRKTSFKFKKLCAAHSGRPDSLAALKSVIDVTFGMMERRLGYVPRTYLLLGIKTVDPVGFMAYLAKNNVDETTQNVGEWVNSYRRMKANDPAFFKHFAESCTGR